MPTQPLEYDSQYTGAEIDEAVAKTKNMPSNISIELANKVKKIPGYGLSERDFSVLLKSGLDQLLAAPKVDEVRVKALYESNSNTNALTDALLTKLTNMEGSHFKGVFNTLADVTAQHPTAERGSYAYIKKNATDVTLASWNGSAWVELNSGTGQVMTAGQIKSMYESNVDTNAFTDGDKSNIQVLFNRLGDLKLRDGVTNTKSEKNIELEATQVISSDPAIASKDNRLITVANALAIELALKQWVDINAMTVHKTPVTDVALVSETGIYYGHDVLNSPTKGNVMVMASKDEHGNMGYFLMGDDMVLHTGGRPNGGTGVRWAALVQASEIGDLSSLTGGHDLAYLLAEMQKTLGQLQHSSGQNALKVKDNEWVGTIDVDGAQGKFIMADIKDIVPNPSKIPAGDIEDGTEGWVKFTSTKNNVPSDPTWIWQTDNSNVPGRIYVDAAATKGVAAVTIKAWIDKGVYVKMKKVGGDYIVTDLFVPAVAHPTGTKALLNDGSVGMIPAYNPRNDNDIATIKTIRSFRHTVVMDTADHNKATRAEAIGAFKHLPHYDFKRDDQFYIKDTTGKKMISMKYFADGAVDEASAGRFYFRAMSECV